MPAISRPSLVSIASAPVLESSFVRAAKRSVSLNRRLWRPVKVLFPGAKQQRVAIVMAESGSSRRSASPSDLSCSGPMTWMPSSSSATVHPIFSM